MLQESAAGMNRKKPPVQRELSESALIKTNYGYYIKFEEEMKMNFELVKQAIALYNQLEKENGFISLSSNSCHVQPYLLKGMENLSVTSRNDKDFPFKITAEMDGVKYFALATTKEIAEFPQCKEDVRAELLKQLAALDDKNEGELV